MPKEPSKKKATKVKPNTRFSFILPAAKKTQPARRSSPATSTSSRPTTPPQQGSVAPPRHAHRRPTVPPAEQSRRSTPLSSAGNEEEEVEEEEEEDVEDEAAAARHHKLIERAVDELQQIAGKHKRPAVTETSSSIHVFLLASRGIIRVVPNLLFLSLTSVLAVGFDGGPDFELEDSVVQKEEKDDLLRISRNSQRVAAYAELARIIPGLDTFLKAIHHDPATFYVLAKTMQSIASEAKCDDTRCCKEYIPEYILDDPLTQRLHPPLLSNDKTFRGFNHPVFGAALIPRSYHEAWVKNMEKTKEAIQQGKIKIDNSSIPMMLYDKKLIRIGSVSEGLLRSPVLVRMYRHIMLGKSNAYAPAETLPPNCNAKKHGLTQCSGATIAYVACVSRFAMCSTNKWNLADKAFKLEHMYREILQFLHLDDENPDPWVIETLRWWNTQVFGRAEGAEEDEEDEIPMFEPSNDLLGFQAEQQKRLEEERDDRAPSPEVS
ncbi:hypothetical protein FB107DRAFT_276701 [Schizophyllum commune]